MLLYAEIQCNVKALHRVFTIMYFKVSYQYILSLQITQYKNNLKKNDLHFKVPSQCTFIVNTQNLFRLDSQGF